MQTKILKRAWNRAARHSMMASAAALCCLASAAQAEIRFSIPQADANAVTKAIAKNIAYLNENSDMEIKQYGEALLKQSEVASGLRDGIVGIGFVVTAYLPAEYSEMNLMANLSMLATSGTPAKSPGAAATGAMMEYVLLNCPECLAQFKAQRQVFLSPGSTNPYDLLCEGSVTTLEELKGKKIRSGAANFGRWAELVGATTVSIPSGDVFDAMSQGVLDCNMLSTADIVSNGLLDVVDTALLGVPGGVYSGFASNTVNIDTWMSLSEENRKLLFNTSPVLAADINVEQHNNLAQATKAATEAGISINEIGEDLRQHTAAFVQADLAIIAEQFKSQYGVSDVDRKIELAAGLIEKWKGLTNEIDLMDRDGYAALYQQEIYSKIDPATYGMD